MTAKKVEPFDGAAVVLHLIEAARAWRNAVVAELDDFRSSGLLEEQALAGWVEQLEARYDREKIEPEPVGWEPRQWREVIAGDFVQMGGVQAMVKASTALDWHVDPSEDKDNQYRPRPMEHSAVRVTLSVDEWPEPRTYSFPVDGEVETLRGSAGQALDEANGYRSVLAEEPINVMQSWAEDAAATLNSAGLGPVEVIQ